MRRAEDGSRKNGDGASCATALTLPPVPGLLRASKCEQCPMVCHRFEAQSCSAPGLTWDRSSAPRGLQEGSLNSTAWHSKARVMRLPAPPPASPHPQTPIAPKGQVTANVLVPSKALTFPPRNLCSNPSLRWKSLLSAFKCA